MAKFQRDITTGKVYRDTTDGKIILTDSTACCCDCCADVYEVASITRSGTTATATTVATHYFFTGQTVTIAGCVETAYNGAKTITVTGTTTFTYTVAGSPSTPATTLTIITASPQTCNNCPAECTPETVHVVVSGVDIVTGCTNCAADGLPASWNVTGSFPDQTFCLSRIGRCAWNHRETSYAGITVNNYVSTDCSGPVNCTFDILDVGYGQSSGSVGTLTIGLQSSNAACNTNYLSPGTYINIFEDVAANNTVCTGSVELTNDLTYAPTICANDPASNPRNIGYNGTATVSRCCTEEGI